MSHYYTIEGFKSHSEFIQLENILHEEDFFPGKVPNNYKELTVPTNREDKLKSIVKKFAKHLRVSKIKEYKPKSLMIA